RLIGRQNRGRGTRRIRAGAASASPVAAIEQRSPRSSHRERVCRYAPGNVDDGSAKCGGGAGRPPSGEPAQPGSVDPDFRVERILSTSRSEGWKLAMDTLFKSSSVSTMW